MRHRHLENALCALTVSLLLCCCATACLAEEPLSRDKCLGPGRDGAKVVYITVDGLGHTWAGGRSLLPESIVGGTSDKINATDVIWDFFQKDAKCVEDKDAGQSGSRE